MDEKIPELTLTPDLAPAPALELTPQEEKKPAPEAGAELAAFPRRSRRRCWTLRRRST